MCPAPAEPYWNPLIGIFHIFRPFSANKTSETQQHPLAQIPMRQGRENRKERRRDLSLTHSLFLSRSLSLSFSLVLFASNGTRGQMGYRRRRGRWEEEGEGGGGGEVVDCPCLLLLFAFSHGDGSKENSNARQHQHSPPISASTTIAATVDAATAIIIAATFHYHR